MFNYSSPFFSHVHPQTAQAVTGRETGTFRRGDGVLLPPAAGIHQRAQPGGQLPGHGPSPLLHQTLHPGRVCPRAGNEPPAHFTAAPAPREAQCPQDEGGALSLYLSDHFRGALFWVKYAVFFFGNILLP